VDRRAGRGSDGGKGCMICTFYVEAFRSYARRTRSCDPFYQNLSLLMREMAVIVSKFSSDDDL
jgi:hypothetical protein